MKKGAFRSILILLMLVAITTCTKSKVETTGNIEGKIIDKINAQPIPAAEVKISGSNQTIISGADGSYKFISLAPKEYQITVSKQNYVQETKTISVIAGQTVNLDFALSPFGLTITPTNQDVGDTAGTTQFTITSNINWTASIDQSWCTLDKTSGSGNDIITVTHLVNTTMSERRATLTVTGNTLAPENVTVTQSPSESGFIIGADYQGGKIAYILQSGDPGYVAGETHGLIASDTDLTDDLGRREIQWSRGTFTTTGAIATALGTGSANTTAIITSQGDTGIYAAKICRDYNGGGYTDWFLPSKDELNQLYLNRDSIGGFAPVTYWSSSEFVNNLNNLFAWCHDFENGGPFDTVKNGGNFVRAVRAF